MESMAATPTASVPKACNGWGETMAGAGLATGVSGRGMDAGCLVLYVKSGGELRSVIGQDFGDCEGQSQFQTAKVVGADAARHDVISMQEQPERGTVNRDE